MTDRELEKILNAIKYVPDEDERDEATRLILKAASESITLERLKAITAKEEKKADFKRVGADKFIKFTKQEINSMPDYLRKLFTINDKIVTYRVTKDGYYQARYRRDGYCIEVASKDFNTMKRKFLDKFAEVERERLNHNYPLFKDFVAEWLKIKRRTVKESTYNSYSNLLNFHVVPRFGKYHVNEIARKEIQEFLFELTDEGKMRTAQKIKVLLTAMYDVICDDCDIKSPMRKIVLSHYEVKKGNAFTKAEEKRIVDFCAANRQFAGNSGVLLLLYTGMRVGEIDSMEFDGKYITCVSEKTRKGRKDVIRKIPLSPMMKRVMPLIDFEQAKAVSRFTIRDALKRIFPDRHVHELRYTFITRAKECVQKGNLKIISRQSSRNSMENRNNSFINLRKNAAIIFYKIKLAEKVLLSQL